MTDDRTAGGPTLDGGDAVPHVFISYSRDDRALAMPIIDALSSSGADVWWDGLLAGGDRFAQTTETALETAGAIVVLWSKTSVESHWVRDEATRGRDRGCMISVSLDGTQPPLGFRQIQYIDLSDWNDDPSSQQFQDVLQAVEKVAGAPGTQLNFKPPTTDPVASKLASPEPATTGRLSRRSILLMAGVGTVVAAGGGIAVWRGGLGSSLIQANSIAVMAFDNLSSDPEQEYFSAGLSEELRATLSLNRWLSVAARVSTDSVQESAQTAESIASTLGVSYILEGSVRRSGDELRVTTRLIDGSSGLEQWSRVYDRQMSNVLELQEEIATSVVDELVVTLAPTTQIDTQRIGGTNNPQALDSYLVGIDHYDRSEGETGTQSALASFDQAIALDENYALAHAARARTLGVIGNTMASGKQVASYHDQAIAAAQRAIEIAPDLAEGHAALGFMLTNGTLDMAGAREPYAKSVELGFGNARILVSFGLFAAFTGIFDEGRAALIRAERIDPLNPSVWRAAAFLESTAGNAAPAREAARKALSLSPQITIANSVLGDIAYRDDQFDQARDHYLAETSTLGRLSALAIVEQRLGNVQAAQDHFDELLDRFGDNSLYQQAQVLAQWGQTEQALEAIERAYTAGDSGLVLSHTDPRLDPIRQEPRFDAIQTKLGFTSIREE